MIPTLSQRQSRFLRTGNPPWSLFKHVIPQRHKRQLWLPYNQNDHACARTHAKKKRHCVLPVLSNPDKQPFDDGEVIFVLQPLDDSKRTTNTSSYIWLGNDVPVRDSPRRLDGGLGKRALAGDWLRGKEHSEVNQAAEISQNTAERRYNLSEVSQPRCLSLLLHHLSCPVLLLSFIFDFHSVSLFSNVKCTLRRT